MDWISVEDRLPEKGIVLVANAKIVRIGHYIHEYKYKTVSGFTGAWGGLDSGFWNDPVTILQINTLTKVDGMKVCSLISKAVANPCLNHRNNPFLILPSLNLNWLLSKLRHSTPLNSDRF